jgi:uncharacterized repeat protein (TIGR01451 family)
MKSMSRPRKLFQQIFRYPFQRLRGMVRSSILFLSVFLLIVTQNYWLFITPVLAATPSPLLRVTNSFTSTNTPINSAIPGIPAILTIQINNDGSTPLTNLSFINNLVSSPGALIIPSTPAITSTCGGTVNFTSGSYPGTSGSIALTGGNLNGTSACQIQVPVQGFVAGNHTQTIASNTVTSNTISNQDPTSATLQVKSSSPATLSKGFSPNTIPGDGRSRITLTITNPNPYALSGAALSDNLPTNLIVDTRSGAITPTTTCTGGTVNILSGDAGVALVGGTIPTSGNCTITFDTTSSSGGSFTNTIPANALTTINSITNTSSVSANLNVQTQISIAKAFGATTLVEENTTTATITITNGGNPLTNANLTDSLPSPLTIANTNASTTCTASGTSRTLAVTAGANSFTLNNGNVAVDNAAIVPGSNPATNALGTCTVTVNVKAGAGAIGNLIGSPPALTATNTIPANSLGNSEGRTNDTPATANINIQPALVVTKSYSGAIAPGSTSRLTINVTNNSTTTATGVGYTDNLPTGLIVANPPNLDLTSCPTGNISPTLINGATAVILTNTTINGNATCSVKFDVTTPTTTTAGTNFDNVIPDNSVVNNQGFDSDGVMTTEGRISVVSRTIVSKVFNPIAVGRGLPSQLKITIANNRRSYLGIPEPLTGIAITDNLPPNLQVANPANFSNTCNGLVTGATSGSTSLSLTGGSINPNSFCAITLDTIEIDQSSTGVPLPAIYNNTPTAFSNNEGETATLPTAQLTVKSPFANSSKVFQSPKIAANGISSAVITLSNSLPINLTNTTFNDTWTQTNVIVANPPNASTTCTGGIVTTTPGSRTVAITGGTVPPQINGVEGLCTVRFDVIMDGSNTSTFDNIIPANAISTNQGFTNLTDLKGTLTRVITTVNLLKSILPTNITAGQPSTLTVTVTNPATGIDLTNLSFVDDMAIPSTGMVVYSVPAISNTCGGTISATPGSNLFTLAGGSLNANNSCTVTLKVTSSMTGNRTNTLPIGVITTREGVSNIAAASASISAGPGLSVSKSFLPANISTNGRSKLTIIVTNGSSDSLTAVNLTDPLPTNMVVANPPNASKTCASGTLAPIAGDTSIVFTGATLTNGASCTLSVDVKSSVAGTFVNTIPVGNVTASGGLANPVPITANLVVYDAAKVLIVKRITAINSTSFTNFVDDSGSTEDNNTGWPAGYIKGEINVPNGRPKDIIEYTIYFLNVGLGNARGVKICDRLAPYQTYIPNSYNGLTPRDSTSTSDLGMALAIGDTTPTSYLTTANDPPDRGQYLAKPTAIPTTCNLGTAANPNGTVVVDVTRSSDLPTLASSTGTGTPPTSYGYVRFRTAID